MEMRWSLSETIAITGLAVVRRWPSYRPSRLPCASATPAPMPSIMRPAANPVRQGDPGAFLGHCTFTDTASTLTRASPLERTCDAQPDHVEAHLGRRRVAVGRTQQLREVVPRAA